jgi:hypothetical protein
MPAIPVFKASAAGPRGPVAPDADASVIKPSRVGAAPSTGLGPALSLPATPELPLSMASDLKLPSELAPPPTQYAQRAPEVRERILEQRGGDPDTERAVQRALAWFAAHQHRDGHWDSHGFDRGCGECDGSSTVDCDSAVTGLALLCFLGADHTQAKDGPYRDNTSRAVTWLLEHQDEAGDFRSGESMYTHAIVTIALAEAHGMTRDPRLAEPLARAVRFIERAKSKQGGWRYEPGQAGDTSVLGWQLMAMVSARRAGIQVSESAIEAAGEFLDSVSRRTPGLYAYQNGQPPTASMTAEGLFCRQLLGDTRDSERTAESLGFLAKSPPKWSRRSTTYYWYYATLAMFQHGGAEWEDWNTRLKKELLAHQRGEGAATGSWDPLDRWSLTGGRVYQTAICTLSLEVYYRYLPMYENAPKTARNAENRVEPVAAPDPQAGPEPRAGSRDSR